MLDCEVFGVNAGAHHLMNVAFHLVNALLLFFVIRGMTGTLWRSAVVASLFALHPLHVESVAWVSERKDVLCAFFGLLSLTFYVRYVRKAESGKQKAETGGRFPSSLFHPISSRDYWLSLGCFTLGLMSKPMLVTWPFVMLLLDYWPLKRFTIYDLRFTIFRLVREKIPFFAFSAASCAITFLVQKRGGAMESAAQLSLADRISNAMVSYGRYLGKTIWPVDLAVLYPHPGHWPFWQVVVAAIIFLSVSLIVLALLRRMPWLAVGWFWFVGTLVPVIGLVQVGVQAMADRYTYIPHIGLFVAVVWTASELTKTWPSRHVFAFTVSAVVMLACSIATWAQARHWKNSITLFSHALTVTTNNALAQYNYGQALEAWGQSDEAMQHYRETLRINPDYFAAHVNLGSHYYESGNLSEATNHLIQAVRIRPGHSIAHYNLGLALAALGDWREAEINYAAAALDGRSDFELQMEWGRALAAQHKTAEAAAHYRDALRLQPDLLEALNDLAWLLATDGDPVIRNGPEAVRCALRACELTQYQQAVFVGTLAAAYAEDGQFDEAQNTAVKAIALAEASGQKELVAKNQQLLELYQNGQAFRETPSTR